MNSVSYNGNVVNTAISGINHELDNFSSLSNELKGATQELISAKGFQEYIGGISSDTFSSVVEESARLVQELVHNIRQKQVSILSYSEDKEEIRNFINSLSRTDYQKLDLTELNQYIGAANSASNLFKGVTGTALTAATGLVEGVGDFFETGADLLDLGRAIILTPFLLGNNDKLQEMWNDTKARVQEKKVENAFDNFYSNTALGQYMKNNAYGFDMTRGISKGLGYTAGIIGLNVVSGGLASGGIGAAGSISAGSLGATAGVLGFANGTEEAWADGASLAKGLKYGVAAGAWEGAQWYAGARINQIGGLGDQIAEGIFKGAKQGVGVRIGLDTLTAGLDAFARPGLSMIYKDYDGATTLEKYQTAFQAAGGWKNVATQAAIGGLASAFSERIGARKLLKAAEQKEAAKVFASEGGALIAAGEAGDTALRLADTGIDIDAAPRTTSPLRTKPQGVPNSFRWFDDGAYVPPAVESYQSRGIFQTVEKNLPAEDIRRIIQQNASSVHPETSRMMIDVTNALEREGLSVNLNGLKLIVNHSEGNVGRIRQALAMSYGSSVSDETLERIANSLSKNVFQSSMPSFVTIVRDDFLTELQRQGKDTWERSGRLIGKTNPETFLLKKVRESGIDETMARTRKYFGSKLSENTVIQIASCDGYPASIRKILLADGTVPESMIDVLSEGGAAKIFHATNLARIKAINLVSSSEYDKAVRLASTSSSYFESQADLLKVTHMFGAEEQTRRVYYNIIDDMVAGGSSLREATLQARMIEGKTLTSMGKNADFLFRSMPDEAHFTVRDSLYRFHDDLFTGLDNTNPSKIPASSYLRQKYVIGDSLDLNRMIKDFNGLLAQRGQKVQIEAALKSYDPQYSKAANELVVDSFIKAARDPSNPNRREAILFMSKMLELNEQGKPITIMNNAGKTGSHHLQGTINLDNCTVDGGQMGTAIHETGHYVFEAASGGKYPADFEATRLRAVSYLDEPAQKSLMTRFAQNEREIKWYTTYEGDRRLARMLQQEGFSSIDEYRNAIAREYQLMSSPSRAAELRKQVASRGDVFYESFDERFGGMDYKSAYDCACAEINAMKSKASDAVYRAQFPEYEHISGMVDSASKGTRRVRYGHGTEYFNSRSDSTRSVAHEMIADYSSMKVRGDNKTIRFVRKVLGNEFMDMIDSMYRQMLS